MNKYYKIKLRLTGCGYIYSKKANPAAVEPMKMMKQFLINIICYYAHFRRNINSETLSNFTGSKECVAEIHTKTRQMSRAFHAFICLAHCAWVVCPRRYVDIHSVKCVCPSLFKHSPHSKGFRQWYMCVCESITF